MKAKMDGVLNPEHLQQYAILDKEGDFEDALKSGGKVTTGGLISVKSSRTKVDKKGKLESYNSGKKRGRDHNHSSKSKKKIKS